MKYLKKYLESKLNTYDSMDTEDLEDLLHWSTVEYNELGEKISRMRSILRDRKENSEEEYSKSFPKSIFQFNKDQCDWIFEHHHGTTQKKYYIGGKYFRELKGFTTTGFNSKTKQHYFALRCYDLEDYNTNLDPIAKSMKFLGDNLKRDEYEIKTHRTSKSIESVKFGIQYANSDEYNDCILYVSENEIYYNYGYSFKKFDHGNGGIEGLLEFIKERDSED